MKFGALINFLEKHVVWLIFAIVLLARLLPQLLAPLSPYWEEVALGYDAWSLLQTAKDHHGNWWPLAALPSFGDFKPPLYAWLTIPFLAMGGLTPLMVRLPAMIASAAIASCLYMWGKRTKITNAGWLAALTWLIQPWAWQVGSVGFEVNVATALYCFSLEAIWKARESKKTVWFMIAAVAAALSLCTYHSLRVIMPLSVIWLVFNLDINIKWIKNWIAPAIIAAIMLIPILLALNSPIVTQRLAETSILATGEHVRSSNYWREIGNNSLLSRLFFHRYSEESRLLSINWLTHFSPQFWFGQGDSNLRHHSQIWGGLWLWEAVTIGIGYAYLARKQPSRAVQVTGLAVIVPLAAMLTTGTPHALRTLPLAPWLALLSGLGLALMLKCVQEQKFPFAKWLAYGGAVTVLLASAGGWLLWRISSYPTRSATEWQSGYQQVIEAINLQRQDDEDVTMSRFMGRPAMYWWFYNRTPPQEVQAVNNSMPKDQQEFLQFENIYFDENISRPGLLAVGPDTLVTGREKVQDVTDQYGAVRWSLWR